MTRWLLPLTAMLAGVLLIVAVGLSASAWVTLQHERRHNSITACISKENEHAVIRSVLESFHVPLLLLPADPLTGRPAFQPLPGRGSTKQRCIASTDKRVHG